MLLRIKYIVALLAVLFAAGQVKATNDPVYTNQLFGKLGQLEVNSVLYNYDGNFLSFRSKIEKTKAIKNVIAFAIDEESQYYIQSDFTDTIDLEITSKDTNNVTTVFQKSLVVNYAKTDAGNPAAKYQAMAYYVYNGGVDVSVKILHIKSNVTWDATKVLKLVNEIQAQRDWAFDCSMHVDGIATDSLFADEWKVKWNDPQNWQTEYDLEWAWIDESAVANYQTGGTIDIEKIFFDNATRITTDLTSYKIPLLYDGTGRLYVRVRSAQVKQDGFRVEAPWSYGNPAVYLPFSGHEDNLNWQASTSFAEGGKRKSVIQYFDGSLRNRQTVTKDNTSNTTVVAETMYDYQGRPVIQVLPAPTLNTMIGFTKNFNQFDDAASGKSVYDKLDINQSACSKLTAKMQQSSGAAQYYSPSNPLKNDGINQYIPDAEGYVYSETRFTNDGTGRVDAQGGVGLTHQVNGGHDTKYFYESPDQQDLDALFGTDAGIASHYSKTWVKDANGQYSVNYTDMHGRTVATALAGTPPANLDALPSSIAAEKSISRQLIDKETNNVNGNSIISSKPLMIAKADDVTFNYQLSPEKLQLLMCTGETVCFDCLYELNISIIPDCTDKVIPGFTNPLVVKNFTLGQYLNQCTGNAPALNTSFTVHLDEGAYTVVKELKLSKDAQQSYRENVYLQKDTCKTLQDFINTQYSLALNQQHCYVSCAECNAKLGSLSDFRIRFKVDAQLSDSMMTVMEPQIVAAYNTAKENCDRLCNMASDGDIDELQGIKDAMLQDMTPPMGQYARTENSNNLPYNIFAGAGKYKAPYDYNTVTGATTAAAGYKDNLGNVALTTTQLAAMGIDEFTTNFDPLYANQLLYAHPEFCKLKVAETTLKGTYRFASKLQNTNTWTDASVKGFISSLMAKDSFFILVGQSSTYATQMQVAISSNFVSLNSACGQSSIGIWKLAKLTVFNKKDIDNDDQDAICAALAALDNNPPSTVSHCQADLDMVWKDFRSFYITYRNSLISTYIDQQCTTNIDNLFTTASGYNYERRFVKMAMQPPYTSQLSDIGDLLNQGGTGDYDGAMDAQNEDNCRTNAGNWMNRLRRCTAIDALANTHSSTWLSDSVWLVNALVYICKPGVDYMGHPYGAASLPDNVASVVIPDLSGNSLTIRSFPDIIRYYLTARSIAIDQFCYPELIDYPSAYNVAPPTVQESISTVPSACQCERINYFNTLWQNAGSPGTFSNYLLTVHGTAISADTLNMLLSMCTSGYTSTNPTCNFLTAPITLPAIFQCRGSANPDSSKTCINCADYANIKQAFATEFGFAAPVEDPQTPTDVAKNHAFEDFANYRTGFHKLWTDYVDFGRQCAADTGYTCTSLDSLLQVYYQSPEYIANPVGDECKASFVQFMNTYYGVTKTYDEWMNIFLAQCGTVPTVCQPYISCLSFNNLVDAFYNTYGVTIWKNTNCEALFTNYFNAAEGTNYTYATIIRKYSLLCNSCALNIGSFPNSFLFTKAYNKFKVDNAGVDGSIDSCQQRFTDFFNTYFELQATPWSWGDISDAYGDFYDRGCGPDINQLCSSPFTCASWETVINLFKAANPTICAMPKDVINSTFAAFFNNYFSTHYIVEDVLRLLETACSDLSLCGDVPAPDCAALTITLGDTYPVVPGHCEDSFVSYFNGKYGTTYTYGELVLLYANCGITLNLGCDTVPIVVVDCRQLQRVVHDFKALYDFGDPGQTYDAPCTILFTAYFNSIFNTTLDFVTIKAWYRIICGDSLDVCSDGSRIPRMVAAVNDYMAHYGTLQLPLIARQQLFTFMFNRYMNTLQPGDPVPDPNGGTKFEPVPTNYSFEDIVDMMEDNGGLPPSLTIENQNNNIYNAQVLYNFKTVYYLLHPDGLPSHCSSDFTAWVNLAMGSTYDYDSLMHIYNSVLGDDAGNICGDGSIGAHTGVGTGGGEDKLFTGTTTTTIPLHPGPTLCGLNVVLFPPAEADTSQCHDPYLYALQEAKEKYQLYIDSIRNAFDVAYYNKCIKAKDLESLTVTYHTAEYHYTLYYYDQAGLLVKTVPPAGVDDKRGNTAFLQQVKTYRANVLAGQPETSNTLTPTHTLVTEYRYNTLNQVIVQKTPDAGESHFWYDRLGRLVVSQNAKQFANNKYSYSLHDALGRITEVGQLTNATVINQTIARSTSGLSNWLANKPAEQIIRTFYDKSYFDGSAILAPQYLVQQNLRNRVSFSAVYTTGVPGVVTAGSHTTATYYSYDIHGNVDTLLQDYAVGTMNDAGNRFKKIVYEYDLISGKVNTVSYQSNQPDAFYHRYSYDAENHLTDVETSHDKLVWERDVRYSYYKHGLLARVILGQQQVQGVDYAYNIQGWLKGINSTSVGDGTFDMGNDGVAGGANSNIARDAYGLSLNYFNGDYKALNSSVIPFANISIASDLYTGNIKSMVLNIPQLGAPLTYGYGYDQLNRLVKADAYNGLNNATNIFTPISISDYKEQLSYDPNGNIKTYLRNGTGVTTSLNNYSYIYTAGTNKLASVTNTVNAQTKTYAYDEIGNTTADGMQGMTNAVWNAYGKMQSATNKDGASITYTYDAAGQRISKKVGSVEEWYVKDASGNTMATYKKDVAINSGHVSATEFYKYGSSLLGIKSHTVDVEYIAPATSTTTFVRGEDGYILTDARNNTLAVVRDTKTPIANLANPTLVLYYLANIATANYYSSFGATAKTYGQMMVLAFNGQRKSTEIGADAQTAEFWEYNGDVGRRANVDPKPNLSFSPYVSFMDNPILYTDLLGDTGAIQVSKKMEIKYVDKRWINSKTRELVDTKKISGEVKQLMSDYEKLNGISEYDEVTKKINESSVNVLLESTKKSSETYAQKYFDGKSGNNLEVNLSKNDEPIPGYQNINRKDILLPTYIRMGHELGHVFDILNKKPYEYFQTHSTIISVFGITAKQISVSKSEISATYWENILRIHANIPIRKEYGSSNNPNITFIDNETMREKTANDKVVSREIFDGNGRVTPVPIKD